MAEQGGEETRVGSLSSHDGSLNGGREALHWRQRWQARQAAVLAAWRKHLGEGITHEEATIPLAWQALLTGLIDALIYSRSAIWTGFQTGEWAGFGEVIRNQAAWWACRWIYGMRC